MTRSVVIIGFIFAAVVSLAFLAVGKQPPDAELYFVSAYIGPFGAVDEALEEVKEKSLWASWTGSVSIVIEDGRSHVIRRLSMPCLDRRVQHINGTVEEGACIRLVREGGGYVLIYRHKGKEVRFRGPTVEDVLWQALQSGEVAERDKVSISINLVYYLYNIPLTARAWAIPFCNGTYYGPLPRPKVAVDNVIRYIEHPENRTIKILKAPEYVEIPLQSLGPRWLNGRYVVDACFLTGVSKEGVVAIVMKENLKATIDILKKYTDFINIQPIN
mgnify:FL=1